MILASLVEGSSVNATTRMCDLEDHGSSAACRCRPVFAAEYHDLVVCDLESVRVQLDEIWGFCGCKDNTKEAGANGYGSVWTWTAIDSDSKLCVSYLVGDREGEHVDAFLQDVANRLVRRVQLTSDGLSTYEEAVELAFGGDVDYAMLIKTYGRNEVDDERRYSPPQCTGCRKQPKVGSPDPKRH